MLRRGNPLVGSAGTRPARLSAMDAAFLAIESDSAPMHLGWAAVFAPPGEGPPPRFEAIRAQIEARLGRTPRYRQRLVDVPLRIAEPVWVDDEAFDISNHVRRAGTDDLGELVDSVMSTPLQPGRPLWELWIAERLDDGCLGVVGKAHHCLVDGLAAVELMALLLDATPEPDARAPEAWVPAAAAGRMSLLRAGLRHHLVRALGLALGLSGLLRRPRRWLELPSRALRCARAVSHAALPLAPRSRLNGPLSVDRHLAWSSRSLDDLNAIKRHFGTTLNDVVLAASAGALRSLMRERGEGVRDLKAMVPVSVRHPEERWGNHLAFLFPKLPCGEPDPARRLRDVHRAMRERKRAGEPEGAAAVLDAVSYAPRPLRNAGRRVLSSPRLFNLIVSNVPGPPVPLFLMGCRVVRAYPAVPLIDGHGVSIGMTSVDGRACFGVYAQATLADDAERLAQGIDDAIGELLARCEGGARSVEPMAAVA